MIRTTPIRSSPQAHRWGCIFATSLGAVPAALLKGSHMPSLHKAFEAARLLSAGPINIHKYFLGEPSVDQHLCLPQQKFTFWIPSRTLTKAQASPETFANTEAGAETTSAAAQQNSEASPAEGRADQDEGDSVSGNGSKSSRPEQLCFKAAAALIPHPDKVATGGEDAYFISDNGLGLGVSDGVSSWAMVNVDAGIYSRLLMSNAKKAAEKMQPGSGAPKEVLIQAHSQTNVQGSATACIVMLDGSTLHAANLGDSGFLVLRNNQIVMRSPPQQHQFNFPFQLAAPAPKSRSDPPQAAECFTFDVKKGDVVVVATDGLIDNVFPQETASIISVIQRRGDSPQVAASGLAQFARHRAEDANHCSPFAYGARRAGLNLTGGKLDDIAVIVAYVAASSRL